MRKLLFIIVALLYCQFVVAQDAPILPKEVKVGKPKILKPESGTYKLDDLQNEFTPGGKWGTKKTEKEFWRVFSDRNRNTLYADPERTITLSTTLAFGQHVVIAQVKGDMALVYEDPKMDNFPIIPTYAKSLGWIPMEHLLLWDKCPTDARGVQNKALIAINLNKSQDRNDFKGKYYEDPIESENPRDLQMDMNFYFIMKEAPDGKRVLLCQNPTVFGNNLYGWVDDNTISRWNQRACLEPNWDAQFAATHKGVTIGVYADQEMSNGSRVANWSYGLSNGDKDRWNQYRMAPNQLRFPILDKVEEHTIDIHCTTFANSRGDANFDAGMRTVIDDVERMRLMRKQMNIIFVVEATTEMKDVLPSIKQSIGKCNGFQGQGLKVQIGTILYRGASQGESGLEIVALTNYDDPLLLSKFESLKANGKLTTKDRDVALPLAIERAANEDLMGYNKDQNNLIIVIGSRGASTADCRLQDSQLLKKLADNNVQVMSIQVVKNQTGSWVNYNDQMINLIRTNVNSQYAAIGDHAVFKKRSQEDGYNFYSQKSSSNEESVLFAQIRYSKEFGKALSESEIIKYVDNGIYKFSQTIMAWNTHIEESLGEIHFDPAFLKHYLGELGYQRWEKVKAISAFDGYTKKTDGKGENYWHFILYLSGDELRSLLDDLKPAYNAAKAQSDDRKPYVEAMRSIVKAHLGQTKDKGIDSMDADRLQELIYGLDVHTDITNRKTLKEIQDPKMLTTIEFRKMLKNFSANYEKLQSIYNDGYRYRVKMGNDYYYWIPIEDLP